jgi:hypothetical protein
LRPKFDDKGKPIYAKHALPWPAFDVKVAIVDQPAPFDPNANGGVPVEISPATFRMLQDDERILARLHSDESISTEEALAAKAAKADLEKQLQDAQRLVSSLQEQMGSAREAAAASVAGEIAKLKEQLAEANRKLAERKR